MLSLLGGRVVFDFAGTSSLIDSFLILKDFGAGLGVCVLVVVVSGRVLMLGFGLCVLDGFLI